VKAQPEPELNAAQSPEHYLDLEWADLIGTLPRKRFDYIHSLEIAQKVHPELGLVPEKVGLLPYQSTEVWERLKSAMRTIVHSKRP